MPFGKPEASTKHKGITSSTADIHKHIREQNALNILELLYVQPQGMRTRAWVHKTSKQHVPPQAPLPNCRRSARS